MIITLQNPVQNVSLQVGDKIYHVPLSDSVNDISFATDNPEYVGNVESISGSKITIPDRIGIPQPTYDSFLMFSKDKNVNNTSLIGYYAEVKLKNNSTEKAELFTLSSEIAESSK